MKQFTKQELQTLANNLEEQGFDFSLTWKYIPNEMREMIANNLRNDYKGRENLIPFVTQMVWSAMKTIKTIKSTEK